LRNACKRVRKLGDGKNKGLADELENYIKSDYENNARDKLNNELNAKSIYQLAKEKGLDSNGFRRLLYALKSIKFPTVRRRAGKKSNVIRQNYLPLFEKIFPEIKKMWKQEDNYRGWITFFKKEKGWEKSRISKFMRRRILDRTVPVWFFEACPPPPSPRLLGNLVKKNEQLKEVVEKLAGIVKEDVDKNHTYRGVKERLKKCCKNASRTLLADQLFP
jgi:hypothetical protein